MLACKLKYTKKIPSPHVQPKTAHRTYRSPLSLQRYHPLASCLSHFLTSSPLLPSGTSPPTCLPSHLHLTHTWACALLGDTSGLGSVSLGQEIPVLCLRSAERFDGVCAARALWFVLARTVLTPVWRVSGWYNHCLTRCWEISEIGARR